MRQTIFGQKLIGLLLLSAIMLGNFSAFAQTKRGGGNTTQAVNKQTKKECNSGYSGTVNYTKTVQTASSGRFGSFTNMKRVYQANILVRDDGMPQGSSSMSENGLTGSFNFKGRATASASENDNRLDVSEKDDYCRLTLKGAEGKTRVHCESKWNRKMDATGEGETTVFVGLRGRTMFLSLANLPRLSGTATTDSSSSCTGTCSPQKPVGSSSSVDVNSAGEQTARTDEGVIAFNPSSFNRLSGSWTRTNPTPGGTVTETFTWNLSRCAPPLEIADIRFEHKKVPNPNQWIGVDPLSGTYDGNIVKIKAKVINNGGDTAYADVKFSELTSNEALPDAVVSVAVKPGEMRDVEYEWDTNGYAWDENQKAVTSREIKAEIEGDAKTEKIKILPKPVILVHGLWSNAAAWAEWHSYLREAHTFAWEAFPVGEDPYVAKMSTGDHPGNYKPTNTVFQNSQELAKQIKWVREQKNAWHVDVVAHSMGGLISRHYINTFMQPVFDNKPEIAHLVMLGTPNMGSPCADLVGGVFEFFEQNDMNAMRELRPSVVADFNSKVTNRKGVKFSILIGYAVPRTCQDDVRGDGVVPVMSARFNIADRDYAFRDHISLTDDVNFKRFVMPRIAVGPKKSRSERTTARLIDDLEDNLAFSDENNLMPNDADGRRELFRDASYENRQTAEKLSTRQKVDLQPREAKEIEIPAGGGFLGVVLAANTGVVATLKDANGAVVGESKGGLDAVKNPFRVINVEKANGTYKLKLENFAAEPTTVFVGAWNGAGAAASSFTVEAGKPSATGAIPLTAKLTENNSPVLNAKITAQIGGQTGEIAFYDDGKHGDGASGDGVYGASTEKLPNGEYFVEAKAEVGNQTRLAIAQINVGGAVPASKTTRRGK